MRILVIGAGAVGGYVGGSLALAGEDVTFLCSPETGNAIRESGLVLRLPSGHKTLHPPVVSLNGQGEKAFDLAVVALKVFDTLTAIKGTHQAGFRFDAALCLQNGVEAEGILESVLGKGNVIAGTVTTPVGRPARNEILVEKLRGIGLADPHPFVPDLVERFEQAGLNPQRFPEAASMKWSKLLTNLIGNALSAIFDMPPAALYQNPAIFRLEQRQLREALAVISGSGARVVDLPGLPARMLATIIRYLPAGVARPILAKPLGSGRGGKMPSFHVDLHAGRKKLEVQYLNGAVVRFGEKVGVPTPVNRVLLQTLEGMIAGRVPLDAYASNPQKFFQELI